MNACALDFPDDTFDVVMDKGTMDSILCGEGSTANVGKLLSEVTRVLKPSGVFFMTSYSTPDNRLSYLENDEYRWKVVVHTVRTCRPLCSCLPVVPFWFGASVCPAPAPDAGATCVLRHTTTGFPQPSPLSVPLP